MDENSTHEQLILYYFNETGMADSVMVQKEIDTHQEVKEEYRHIVEVFDHIDKIVMSPSEKTINSILDYSIKALAAGHIQ